MKMIFSAGFFLLLLKTCHAEYECYYEGGTTRYCDECCEYDCCEGGSGGLSGGGIAGITVAVIFLLMLKIFCICMRVRRQTTVITRSVTVPRSVVVTTNTNHAGFNQNGIPTVHQPNPNQRTFPVVQQLNPNHHGYDQQRPEFTPIPPPSYDKVMSETAKK